MLLILTLVVLLCSLFITGMNTSANEHHHSHASVKATRTLYLPWSSNFSDRTDRRQGALQVGRFGEKNTSLHSRTNSRPSSLPAVDLNLNVRLLGTTSS